MQDTQNLHAFRALPVKNQIIANWKETDPRQQIRPELTDAGIAGEPPALCFQPIRQSPGGRVILPADIANDLSEIFESGVGKARPRHDRALIAGLPSAL